MKTFTYTARDTTGATRSGTLQAPDRPTALATLQSRNLAPITLQETTPSKKLRTSAPPRETPTAPATPRTPSSSSGPVKDKSSVFSIQYSDLPANLNTEHSPLLTSHVASASGSRYSPPVHANSRTQELKNSKTPLPRKPITYYLLPITCLIFLTLLYLRLRPTPGNSIQHSVSSIQYPDLQDNLNTEHSPLLTSHVADASGTPQLPPSTPPGSGPAAAHLNTEHSPLNTTALPPAKPPRRVTLGSRLNPTNAPPSGYHSSMDRSLNMIVNTRLGMSPPPLVIPPPDTDINAILDHVIHVYDTDSDEDFQRKANVAEAKAALKQYLADGGTTEEFFQYYHDTLTAAAEKRTTAHQEVMALIREGDLEAAQELMDAKNLELEEEGIEPLRLPTRILQN